MPITTDLDAWLQDVASGFKPSTLATYRKASKWIRVALGDLDWDRLKESQLRRAIDQASRRADGSKLAGDTIRLRIVAWDQFQKWAIDTGRIENPINSKPLRKPSGNLRQRLPTPREIDKIVRNARPAFRSIFRALLLTGARPDELCRATIADYDPVRQMIHLEEHKTRHKTKRPRIIPISSACRVILRQAMGDRREGALFLSPHGKPWTSVRLSEAFRRLRKSLDLSPEIVLYSTRHTAATQIVRKKGIGQAAAVLGHSGLQTIQRYVHPDERDLREWADAAG